MFYRNFRIALLVLFFFILSCAKGNEPVTPSSTPELSGQVSELSSERICWGLWDVILNPDTLTADVVPLRGSNFTANVVNFLQPPKVPVHYLTVKIDPDKTNFPAGHVECDVTLKHPFPGTVFSGFDVLGIIMDDWEASTFQSDPSVVFSTPPNTLLQNPDGWTRWWNPVEFTTYETLFGYIEGTHAWPNWACTHTLNAFKYFCDDLDSDEAFDPPYEGRGFFSSENPGVNTRRYKLQFPLTPAPVWHFKYAVSANWVAPLPSAEPPYTADDFPPEANMPEAYKINFINNASTAYYENDQVKGGYLKFLLEIRDWQLIGDPLKIPDEIGSIVIESPTLFQNPVNVDLSAAYFPSDNPTQVYVPVKIKNVIPSDYVNQFLFITVKSAHITTYEPQIPGITGFVFPDGELAAYCIVEAPIKHYGLETGWKTYRKNYQRTGAAGVEGPATSHLKFKYKIQNDLPIRSGIVVDSLGRAIFRSSAGNIYCVESDGDLAWMFPTGNADDGLKHSTPTIGPDDSIYFGDDAGYLWHFNKDGGMLWCQYFPYGVNKGGGIDGGCVVQDDGTILFGMWGGYLVKADQNGEEIWNFYGDMVELEKASGPAVDKDGTIYFAAFGGAFKKTTGVCAIDQDGGLIWKTMIDPPGAFGGVITDTPALGPYGIYVNTTGYISYCLNFDGDIVWSKELGGGAQPPPAVGINGKVIVYKGGGEKNMFCFDQITGDEEWSIPIAIGWGDDSTPVIDAANRIYCGVSGTVYCISPDGDILWIYLLSPMGEPMDWCSPAISDDGTLYVASNDALYAFRDE